MHKYLIDRINVDWIEKIFEFVDANWIKTDDVINASLEDGVEFGKRKDVFNRLVDLGLLEKNDENAKQNQIRLTEKGLNIKNIFLMDRSKGIEYIHMLHVLESFKPEGRRYFATYRFAIEMFMQSKQLKKDDYLILVQKLEQYFDCGNEGVTGMDTTTIAKATVFVKEIPQGNDRDIDLKLFNFGLQEYVAIKTGKRNGQILLSNEAMSDLMVLFFMDSDEIIKMIDMLIKMSGNLQKKFAMAGTYLSILKTINL